MSDHESGRPVAVEPATEGRPLRHPIVTAIIGRAVSVHDRLQEPPRADDGHVDAAQRSWPREAVAFVVIMFLAATVAWWRLDGVRGIMWAEDANIFTQRAALPALQPLWIWTPYAGYTHSVPQLMANMLWPTVDLGDIAVATTAAACLVAGAIAGGVFVLTRGWGIAMPIRLLLSSVTVMAPGLQAEVLGNLANLHWLFLWLAPFLFLFVPRSWVASGAAAAVVLLAVTTEIQMVLFAPLLLLGFGERRRWPMRAAAVAGVVIQGLALLSNDVARGDGERSWRAVTEVYALQVPLTTLTGSVTGAAALVAAVGWLVAAAALVPFVLCAARLARHSPRSALYSAIFFVGGILLWVAGFGINYTSNFDYGAMSAAQLTTQVQTLRYAAVPVMFLLALLAMASARGRGASLSWSASPILICVTLLVLAVVTPSGNGFREGGPAWGDGVDSARTECAGSSDPDAMVSIASAPANWGVTIPCDIVEER